MSYRFSNNYKDALFAPVGVGDTTITVADASGLPSLSGLQFFMLTLEHVSTQVQGQPTMEIIKVVGVAGNVLTVERGQEGTSALTFNVGDSVTLRLTAGALNDFSDSGELISGLQNSLDAHVADLSNPHQVTPAQIGADLAGSAAAVQTDLDGHKADTTIHYADAPADGKQYARIDNGWVEVSAVIDSFTQLVDTPADYAGKGGFYVIVNPTENGLLFTDTGGGGGIPDAPIDGNQYGRQDGAWTTIDIPTPVLSHPDLTNRDAADSHPQAAIGGRTGTPHGSPADLGTDQEGQDLRITAVAANLSNHEGAASDAHPVSAITGLQTALDGKEPVISPKNSAFNKNFGSSGSADTVARSDHNHSGVYSPVGHQHNIADVSGLQFALDAKLAKDGDTMTGPLVIDPTDKSQVCLTIPYSADKSNPYFQIGDFTLLNSGRAFILGDPEKSLRGARVVISHNASDVLNSGLALRQDLGYESGGTPVNYAAGLLVQGDNYDRVGQPSVTVQRANTDIARFHDQGPEQVDDKTVITREKLINADSTVDQLRMSVVSALPGTPDANTIYFVTG